MTAQAMDAHPPAAESHAHHSHNAAHHDDKGDDGCGCESIKAFPAQTATLAKAPAPGAAVLLYSVRLDDAFYESFVTAVATQNTGPPERISFAELVLQQCRFSHAPPFVV
jgi:hypothetical protein